MVRNKPMTIVIMALNVYHDVVQTVSAAILKNVYRNAKPIQIVIQNVVHLDGARLSMFVKEGRLMKTTAIQH